MRPPWLDCCGWSLWCVLDSTAHALRIKVPAICDRHDRDIIGEPEA